MRTAMTTLVLLFYVSLAAQSTSDTLLQRERAKLQAEHTGQGFEALYLDTSESVNQGGQVRTRGFGSTFQTSADPKFLLEEPLTVQVYRSAAFVTGVQIPGGARRVRFVRVWVKDGREWKIAFHQGTTIADAAPTNTTATVSAIPEATSARTFVGEEGAVLNVQESLAKAYTEHDAVTYGRLTAPDFVRVLNSGQVIQPGFRFGRGTLPPQKRRHALIPLGADAINPARRVTPRG